MFNRIQRFSFHHRRLSRWFFSHEWRKVRRKFVFIDPFLEFTFFRFEEAITYYCVACEYNLRLSKQCTLPMRAMDSCLLFKARRLCFEVSRPEIQWWKIIFLFDLSVGTIWWWINLKTILNIDLMGWLIIFFLVWCNWKSVLKTIKRTYTKFKEFGFFCSTNSNVSRN